MAFHREHTNTKINEKNISHLIFTELKELSWNKTAALYLIINYDYFEAAKLDSQWFPLGELKENLH